MQQKKVDTWLTRMSSLVADVLLSFTVTCVPFDLHFIPWCIASWTGQVDRQNPYRKGIGSLKCYILIGNWLDIQICVNYILIRNWLDIQICVNSILIRNWLDIQMCIARLDSVTQLSELYLQVIQLDEALKQWIVQLNYGVQWDISVEEQREYHRLYKNMNKLTRFVT
jgi:hypothetical protein